jgi:transposase
LDLSAMVHSYRGSVSASYYPALLLGILVYGYATGVFSSRRLERASYDSVAFRFITANEQPDHDTIATFRRRFLKEIEELFVRVLELAREMGLLKMGTVALDGTKIHANASRHSALSYEHAGKIEEQLKAEVADLMARAEASVVQVVVRSASANPLAEEEGRVSSGTGFVWDEVGHVVTNDHVVQSAGAVAVRFASGEVVQAKVVGLAKNYDLAVLKIQAAKKLPPPIPLGSSADLKVGQSAFAIGNPSDRCGGQSGKLRWTAPVFRRKAYWRHDRNPVAVWFQCRHRICNPCRHGQSNSARTY